MSSSARTAAAAASLTDGSCGDDGVVDVRVLLLAEGASRQENNGEAMASTATIETSTISSLCCICGDALDAREQDAWAAHRPPCRVDHLTCSLCLTGWLTNSFSKNLCRDDGSLPCPGAVVVLWSRQQAAVNNNRTRTTCRPLHLISRRRLFVDTVLVEKD